ncbi:MAG TPA: YafY family protein [Stackebrandtia sp.]|uniref:helix-turn-helix transcriptional regulator n=1 Tax=Stackebrandtia sp. TaxID=2023065 RepID=UPI002D515B3E|nr:YafY family protein [Stackebrandtia sp.]HZE42043.1 YafY family protein [Stackebrandtia sp.]
MKASRLMTIVLLLQDRRHLTAAQLAAELEVSERTVYRDINALALAGVPVYAHTGPQGGYRLLEGYRTRLTGLTESEARSLVLAGLPDAAAQLGLLGDLSAARLKLLAAVPSGHRDLMARMTERFHFDAPDWYADADEVPFLAEVTAAVWAQRRVEIRYRRWETPKEVTRRLEPLGVVLKAGRWYLVAAARGRVRTYRISRVLELTTLDEEFERPEGFDLAAHWKSYIAGLSARLRGATATIRVSPHGAELAPDLLDPAMARPIGEAPPEPDGWVTATVPIENPDHATGELLRLGADVEALSPKELRTRLAETAEAMAARYR